MYREKIKNVISKCFLIFIIGLFNLFLFLFPKEILNSSRDAIILWANNILPALLPFLIGTNILIKTEIIDLISFFCEPIMMRIFKISGSGSFAVISGMICGYPVGATIIKNLIEENKISRAEAQILISFCNNPGPIFILGTVGINMLNNKKLGYVLMIAIYFAAIINGLIFSFFIKNKVSVGDKKNNLSRIFFYGKNKNFGILISESISEAIFSVLQIGGFVVLFGILCKILELSNIIKTIWLPVSKINFFKELGYKNFYGLIFGLVEITNGAKSLLENNFCQSNLILLTGLMSFGGFCVHMQTISFITKTGINVGLYIVAKITHAFISVVLIKIIFLFWNFDFESANIQTFLQNKSNFYSAIILSCKNFVLLMLINLFLIFIYYVSKSLKYRR